MATVAPTQNFATTDISGRAYGVLLASIICPSIAALFVAARWFVRLRITKSLCFDDWLALVTLISNIAYSVLQGIATQPYIGIGLQQSQFAPDPYSNYYEWVYMFDTVYLMSLLGYKLAILLLYLRVFGVRKHFKWTCWFVMFIIVGYLLAALGVQLGACSPPEKFWDKYLAGTCVDAKRFDIAYGCLNVITDLILTLLPLREIWRLFMPIKEKVWASLIFGSAAVAFGTALVSQIYRFKDLFSEDRTYEAAITFTWQTIEINTGLICSCMPALRPLYRKAAETIAATFGSGSGKVDEVETDISARNNLEKEMLGKEIQSTDSGETSPDSPNDRQREADVERDAGARAGTITTVTTSGGFLKVKRSGSNMGKANKGTRIPGKGARLVDPDAVKKRHIPSDVYMSPLPSSAMQERQPTRNLDSLAAATTAVSGSRTSQEDLSTSELSAVPRGRSTIAATPPIRISQAELERMLRETNIAQAQLEEQAEQNRHWREHGSEEGEGDERYSVHEHGHNQDYEREREHEHEPMPDSRYRFSRKTSCDLEKGVGLRI